jgi:argininosuccinate lyase
MRQPEKLCTAVFDTLEWNQEHPWQRAARGFTTATELADALSKNHIEKANAVRAAARL